MKHIAVIIPTYNDGKRLQKCLDALARQDYPTAYFKVYVVDNNSQEDILAIAQRYSFCQYLRETRPGAYCARNCAIARLEGEQIIAFTDADCIPASDWLSTAANLLKEETAQAIGGAVQVFASASANLIEHYERLYAFPQKLYVEQDHFAVTANLFITRSALELLGPFDETLFSGGDAEWGARMKRLGIPLQFSKDVVVQHPARDTLDKLTNKVKRTVGGCYSQRNSNPIMRRSFSWLALLKGFLPPFTAIKKLSEDGTLSVTQRCQMTALLFYLKYHKSFMKVRYRLKLVRDYERF